MSQTHSVCLKNVRIWKIFYGTHYTEDILADTEGCCMREVKKVIKSVDAERCLDRCLIKAPPIAEVIKQDGIWSKLWDASLHLGTRHTSGLQALSGC